MTQHDQSSRQPAGVGADVVLKSCMEECRGSSTHPFVYVNSEKQAIPPNSANTTLLQFLRGEHELSETDGPSRLRKLHFYQH